MACCLWATFGLVSWAWGSENRASGRAVEEGGSAAAPGDDRPGPAASMAAFDEVRAWVGAWRAPDAGGPGPFVGAGVLIRLDGVLIGRGHAVSADGTPDEGVVRRAAKAAIAEARRRAENGADALGDEAARRAGGRLTLSLELAGPMTPVAPGTYADLDGGLRPGIDGVAVRRGERIEAVFPARMLALGMTPAEAARACISTVTGEPTLAVPDDPASRPSVLSASHGLVFYRFEAVHVAQTAPGAPGRFLARGGRIVESGSMTAAEIRETAESMAMFLVRGVDGSRTPATVRGTYLPTTGATEAASALDRAVVALALLRYAGHASAGRTSAFAASRAALDALAGLGEPASADPLLAAAVTVAMDEAVRVVPTDAAERGLDRALPAWSARAREAWSDEGAWHPSVREAGKGLAAWALVRIARRSGDALDRARAERAVGDVLLSTPPARLSGQLPWLGWADVEMHEGLGAMPAAAAWRECRDEVWRHQVGPGDASDDPDLIGGIVFTASRHPLPSWQSARPVAFMATMLGDPRLTDGGEVLGQVLRLTEAARFLRQLSADEWTGHMYVEPASARGGVRVALWDQRQPPEATAISLLALTEFLRSMDARAGR